MLPTISHHPSRPAAGKLPGDASPTKKTVSAAARFVHGGPSAAMVSSLIAVLPVVVLSAMPMVVQGFWKSAPPITTVPRSLTACRSDADSLPPLPPPKLTLEGKTRGDPLVPARRWWELAWLAEVKGWNYAFVTETNGTLYDLNWSQYTSLAETKGEPEDCARTRHRHRHRSPMCTVCTAHTTWTHTHL